MTQFRVIFSTGLLVLLVGGVFLIWNVSSLVSSLGSLISDVSSHTVQGTNLSMHEEAISIAPILVSENNTDNISTGHYETIEETIARIRRDVNVTGVIVGSPGEEIAFFQIEGLPDRPFKIDTQLMDGFIITEITNNKVVLKNQVGEETVSLNTQRKL